MELYLFQSIHAISEHAVFTTLMENPQLWSKKNSLRQAVDKVHDAYSGKTLSTVGGHVAYDDALNQAAYMFLYFPNHCQATSYGLSVLFNHSLFGNVHLNSLLSLASKTRALNVCSIGGGPGTDIIGLTMMLEKFNVRYPISASVLDHYPQWCGMWGKIKRQIRDRCAINFVRYEVKEGIKNMHISAAVNAHMFTFIKFISAVRALPESRMAIKTLLMCAMPGSYLFYADNRDGKDRNIAFFKELAGEAGFYSVSEFTDAVCFSYNFTGQDQIISSILKNLFQSRPQKFIRMNFMLMKKREVKSYEVGLLRCHPK